ncbi:MAG: hypothetical protein ACJAYB_003453 [Psychromonas sp.]|jgi:hypothetical protein
MATAYAVKVHLKPIKMTIVECVFGAQLGRISSRFSLIVDGYLIRGIHLWLYPYRFNN